MKSSIPKIGFAVSTLALAFIYGVATQQFGWFPDSLLDQAIHQAKVMTHNQRAAPKVYERSGVRIEKKDQIQPGMTVLVSAWKGEESGKLELGARLIDQTGNTLHEWKPNLDELFPNPSADSDAEDFHGSYLLSSGDLVLVLTHIGVARIDACGNVKWRLEEKNHHSVARTEDGSFWVPGVSSVRKTKTPEFPDGLPGLEKPLWMDRMLHISKDGELLEDINVLDVLYTNNLEHYIIKGMDPGVSLRSDAVHLNDIEPLSPSMSGEYPLFDTGDLLVSLKFPDLVFVFDPDSKKVKWYESRYFTRQHDPDFIGSGWIGVFDNRKDPSKRGKMLGGTRIVEVQPHTDSVRISFPTPRSEHHYTHVRGKWQDLANGNKLLVESNAGRVVEVNPDGETVWEWIHEPYETSWRHISHPDTLVPYLTKATRVNLTREDIESWPCSSLK